VPANWAHELKHDAYRLQIHVRDGRVRLYTISGADWSKRYPLIVESAAYIHFPHGACCFLAVPKTIATADGAEQPGDLPRFVFTRD
jgi:hypothetical protein